MIAEDIRSLNTILAAVRGVSSGLLTLAAGVRGDEWVLARETREAVDVGRAVLTDMRRAEQDIAALQAIVQRGPGGQELAIAATRLRTIRAVWRQDGAESVMGMPRPRSVQHMWWEAQCAASILADALVTGGAVTQFTAPAPAGAANEDSLRDLL